QLLRGISFSESTFHTQAVPKKSVMDKITLTKRFETIWLFSLDNSVRSGKVCTKPCITSFCVRDYMICFGVIRVPEGRPLRFLRCIIDLRTFRMPLLIVLSQSFAIHLYKYMTKRSWIC